MRKTIEIIGVKYHHGTYQEGVTEINGKIVTKIDTSVVGSKILITMIDKTGLKVSEIYVPDGFMVKITR